VGDVDAHQLNLAGVGFVEADERLAEGAFAATGFADQAERFALRNVQRDAVQRVHGAGGGLEMLGQVIDPKQMCHGATCSSAGADCRA
jgi:hypothetical protein